MWLGEAVSPSTSPTRNLRDGLAFVDFVPHPRRPPACKNLGLCPILIASGVHMLVSTANHCLFIHAGELTQSGYHKRALKVEIQILERDVKAG